MVHIEAGTVLIQWPEGDDLFRKRGIRFWLLGIDAPYGRGCASTYQDGRQYQSKECDSSLLHRFDLGNQNTLFLNLCPLRLRKWTEAFAGLFFSTEDDRRWGIPAR